MSVSIRLSAYLFLPLMVGTTSFFTMKYLGGTNSDSALMTGIMLGITLLLGLLPSLLYRSFIQGQLQQGFAHMDDGSVLLPDELGIGAILGDRIQYWQSYEHLLSTTVRLHGSKADLLVGLRINLTLWPDKHGKELAKNFDESLPLLERSIQECLYGASLMDDGFALALDGSTLLNEDDERVLKSKFLSALEMLAIEGVFFPHDAAGIHIDRNVKKEKHASVVSTAAEEDLRLDENLLKRAGMV